MKHIIIGTAGHVDHGKTMLVRALTGIDTDRLSEEKKRGITIELGFAHLDFDDGTKAGIVDVPGHEKFIKNMLAGAGGIDLAMLVVAADEGFMPQTVEHLGILSLLGIQEGLVVLTKTDMVEPEWLEMMQEDVADKVRGTFLEGKPIHCVSAATGDGIPELREELRKLVAAASEKSMRVPFRLPVDRVFSVEGFGTVVTGTLIEGGVTEGEIAELSPSGLTAKVRNLQVHGCDVETAYAGQRVAINLAGLKKSEVNRGDTVAKPGTLRSSLMLDARLENLKTSGRIILNNSQVHLYHGSAELLCKVVLLDRDGLHPGDSCYAQLRLTEPLSAKTGDRFVIRFLSPLETIGGGKILDDAPERHKRNVPAVLEALAVREGGSGDAKLLQAVAGFGYTLPDRKKLLQKTALEETIFDGELQALLGRGQVIEALPGRYLAASTLDEVWGGCRGLLESYHKTNPLHAGLRVAELRQKLFRATEQAVADAVLAALVREGKIKRVADRMALRDFEVHLTKKQTAIREKLLAAYLTAGVEPGTVDEVFTLFAPNEQNDCKQVLDSVLSGGDLVMLAPQLCWHRDVYDRVCDVTRAHFETHETLTLAELRDALGTSRKYALGVLEYYDRNKITKKEGDFRRLALGFPEK
ncbi:MAG: selenocysteine-specific translation elongation factor [Oscillospiraceae bacterium]